MSVTARSILDFPIPEARETVTARDAALYALSVGYGAQPLDTAHLRFLYERELRTAPTLANVVAHPGPWMKATGVNWSRLVHAEHRLTIHRPVPLDIPLISRSRSLAVMDRGAEKGMFVTFERVLSIEATGEQVATIVQTNACRGDGGCGSGGAPPKPLPGAPETPPDAVFRIMLPENAALLYRLNGDLNPLHVDPDAAAKAGFARPILHGLCTFGHAGYAVARLADGPGLPDLGALAARFSAPVYPGDALEVQVWRRDIDIHFRCIVPERGVTVLDNGVARLA
jgi:acyl dehydratase